MYTVVIIALLFNLLDVLVGIAKGFKEGLSSSKLRDGMFKKVGFLLVYFLAYLLEYSRPFLDIPIPVDITNIICSYVIFTEVVSVIENLGVLNPNLLPEKIKEMIGLNKGD